MHTSTDVSIPDLRVPATVTIASIVRVIPLVTLLAISAIVTAGAIAATDQSSSQWPVIETADVDRFYRLYDATGGRPSAAQIQTKYIDRASAGFHTLAHVRRVTAESITLAMEKQPELYAGARRCAAAIPAARTRLRTALAKLRSLYPAARTPPVTITIGRGRPVGVGSPVDGVQISLEALCGVRYYAADPVDRLVHVIAHEYVHVQQQRELVDNDANWTVLEGSLVEGAADFIGELISGGLGNPQLARDARGQERALEARFVRDKDKTDLTDWLGDGTMERSGNLGYWMGYRIVGDFYRRSPDKRAAIRQIIEMRDAQTFLRNSGWIPAGGMDDRTSRDRRSSKRSF